MSNVLELTIPASTANLGVGFDSIGMALDKFLHLSVKKHQGQNGNIFSMMMHRSNYLLTKQTLFIMWHNKLLLNIVLTLIYVSK